MELNKQHKIQEEDNIMKINIDETARMIVDEWLIGENYIDIDMITKEAWLSVDHIKLAIQDKIMDILDEKEIIYHM